MKMFKNALLLVKKINFSFDNFCTVTFILKHSVHIYLLKLKNLNTIYIKRTSAPHPLAERSPGHSFGETPPLDD